MPTNKKAALTTHMPDEDVKEWVLPAAIPFKELKGQDLEECVYWLVDAMGAKDLEWRTGGSGGGAADGGRDLEARFFHPGKDGELSSQKWWIECKGRSGTVEADEVKSAVNNALAYEGIDHLVIATNTQFSNPTRDWVKEWQKKHPVPKVQLWDKAQLERYLSRHPDVVLRLFSQALSLQGRFLAMESRFWNKLEFVNQPTLADLWKDRENIEFTSMGMFALIANEFANGEITHRPWGAILTPVSLIETVANGLYNALYILYRASNAGVDQKILVRSYAYLILVALDNLTFEKATDLVIDSLKRGKPGTLPDEALKMLLMPIADQLLSEMQDVCSSDCERISCFDRNVLTENKDEVEGYWLRFEPDGLEEQKERRTLRLEKLDASCKVGFPVNKDVSCPLFEFRPSIKNVGDLLKLVQRVAKFRKAEAAEKRAAEKAS